MKAEKDRCGKCMYGAGALSVFRCNYAGLTGRTRKAQPPEACTYFRAGQRLVTPEEAARQQEARQKKPECRKTARGLDWEKGWDLYQQGKNDGEIAREMGCSTGAVFRWRKRNGMPPNAEPGWNPPKRRLRREERGGFEEAARLAAPGGGRES